MGWRVVEILEEDPCWRRYLAVSPARAALDDDDWLSHEPPVAAYEAPQAPDLPAELIVEVSSRAGISLSDLCEVFQDVEAPSLPELIDIGLTDERETVAVLEATLGSSVEELLDRPHSLAPGEIVTILASVAETLAALHVYGIALGALRCDDVRLTVDGRPVLKNWATVSRFALSDGRVHTAVVRDWKLYESLADLVLAQLPPELELPSALDSELDRCLSGDVDAQLAERLLDALFSWQDATDVQDPAVGQAVPRRAVLAAAELEPAAHPFEDEPFAHDQAFLDDESFLNDESSLDDLSSLDDRRDQPVRGSDQPIRARSLLDDDVRDAPGTASAGDAEPTHGRSNRPRATETHDASRRAQRGRGRRAGGFQAARSVRLPFRIAAAAALVMGICAVSIFALSRGDDVDVHQGSETSSAANETAPQYEQEASALQPQPPADAGPPPNPQEEASQENVPPASNWQTVAAGEDPAAAALALLDRRSECLASMPGGCLEEIYQADAPGLHADLARAESGAQDFEGLTTATLRDRYGDLVVIDLWSADAVQEAEAPPASLTIARGEAGWRLRDVRMA